MHALQKEYNFNVTFLFLTKFFAAIEEVYTYIYIYIEREFIRNKFDYILSLYFSCIGMVAQLENASANFFRETCVRQER